jgi:hypothetical protein
MYQGCFSDQKSQFGYILVDLGMENGMEKCYWVFLWAFGNFAVIWYIFPLLWYIFPALVCILYQEKSGNPGMYVC